MGVHLEKSSSMRTRKKANKFQARMTRTKSYSSEVVFRDMISTNDIIKFYLLFYEILTKEQLPTQVLELLMNKHQQFVSLNFALIKMPNPKRSSVLANNQQYSLKRNYHSLA